MSMQEWLSLFRRHRSQKIFHFQHLKLLSGAKSGALKASLRRLTRAKVIQRICRSFYANPLNPPTLEEISAAIYKPSYISLESALSRHGILSQMPQILTCVTTRLPRTFKTSFGLIRYRQVKKGYFFGFVQEQGCFIAEPEKALVDFLYLNRWDEVQGMVSEFKLSSLSRRKMISYAARMKVRFPRLSGFNSFHSEI